MSAAATIRSSIVCCVLSGQTISLQYGTCESYSDACVPCRKGGQQLPNTHPTYNLCMSRRQLPNNELTTLPDNIFDKLGSLQELWVFYKPPCKQKLSPDHRDVLRPLSHVLCVVCLSSKWYPSRERPARWPWITFTTILKEYKTCLFPVLRFDCDCLAGIFKTTTFSRYPTAPWTTWRRLTSCECFTIMYANNCDKRFTTVNMLDNTSVVVCCVIYIKVISTQEGTRESPNEECVPHIEDGQLVGMARIVHDLLSPRRDLQDNELATLPDHIFNDLVSLQTLWVLFEYPYKQERLCFVMCVSTPMNINDRATWDCPQYT